MKWLLRIFWPFTGLRRWWLENLTTSGNTIVLGLIATANAIWGYPLGPLFSALMVLAVLCYVLNLIYKPRLDIHLQAVKEVEKGELLTLVWTVRNLRRLSAHDLSIHFERLPAGFVLGSEPPMMDAIPPGSLVTITTTVRCNRRGVFPWPTIALTSYYPFGLFRKSIKYQAAGTVAVTPRLIPLRKLRKTIATTMVSGPQLSDRQVGEAFQYIGSREYLPGTSVRRWDFSAWARIGKPIVREFESNRSPRILIWVDGAAASSVREKRAGENLVLEAVYSLAASVARAAITSGARCSIQLSCDFRVHEPDDVGIVGHLEDQRLEGIYRQLAAGSANSREQSQRSLHAITAEQRAIDVCLVLTGPDERSAGIPSYLQEHLPHVGSMQVLVIDELNQISVIRPQVRRRTKRDAQPVTGASNSTDSQRFGDRR